MTDMSEIWKSTLRPALREQWHKLAHAVGPKLAAWCDHQVKFPDGMVFDTPPGMNNPDFLAMLMGRYEAAERSVLRRHFKAADTIIEIGANIGVVTHSVIRDKLQPHGRMICVEPNPDVIPSLASNIERSLMRFASEADVSLVEAALSAPRAAGDIANFNARSGLCSGLTSHLAPGQLDGRMVAVETVSLSSLLFEQGIKGPYSLICDAEGAEIAMILEDSAALKNCYQLAIELHDPALTGSVLTAADLLEELHAQGFVLGGQAETTYYLSRQPV